METKINQRKRHRSRVLVFLIDAKERKPFSSFIFKQQNIFYGKYLYLRSPFPVTKMILKLSITSWNSLAGSFPVTKMSLKLSITSWNSLVGSHLNMESDHREYRFVLTNLIFDSSI